MKKHTLWLTIVALFLIALTSNHVFINKDKLKGNYYELIVAISDLFKDHTQASGRYYNQSYPSKEKVDEFLNEKVTENGFALVIDTLFDEYDDLYVYKQEYQDYLSDSFNFRDETSNNNYYNTVKDSILNPALRLINFEQLNIEKEKDKIILKGDDIKIRFYDEEERQRRYHQYARLGYPPQDSISLSLTFLYSNGNYLLDDFQVKSNGI